MDKYSIYLQKKVYQDLEEIYSYIAGECMEPDIARSVLEKIQETIRSLRHMPCRYPLQHRKTFKGKGIRQVSEKGFVIFYKVYEEQKKVSVLAIRHEAGIQ